MKENCILVDWKPSASWDFQQELEKQTKETWTVKGVKASDSFHNTLQKIVKHYIPYFLFPFSIFLRRNKYRMIIGWQQFFGLILAYYCRLFRVKKYPKIVILTFIYKEKKGKIGKLYFSFLKNILQSKYIHKIIVYSQNEKEYYSRLFELREGLIASCIYTGNEGEAVVNQYIAEEKGCLDKKYFIAPGRSNRDYEFLVRELADTDYQVAIVCDNYKSERVSDNIKIYRDTFAEQYIEMLQNAYAVIVPLLDDNISSGQLVFLKAMQYGKPIIVTKNKSIVDYVKNDANGCIIEKDGNQLRTKMDQLLHNHEYYKAMSKQANVSYNQMFKTEFFVQQIVECVEGCSEYGI
ncbi:MAG: glycosyltransferase [Lachnospiraceae bacterium]